jgi:hypothetical protein
LTSFQTLNSDVPLLTQVVDLHLDIEPVALPVAAVSGPAVNEANSGLTPAEVDQVCAKVMTELQRQIDRMFEFRVREAAAPLVTRLLEQLTVELRDELTLTLTDVVRKAVSQEIARQRGR